MPPLHPNCRSTAVPFFDEAPEGTRAAEGGQVDADVSYEEWLKTRPQAEQDEMLGKKKAAAWRTGQITFAQMINGNTLEPITIKRLQELDRL